VIVREIRARSILTRSNLPGADFCINPYVGCSHACPYCYARFMARYAERVEPWGEFVDVKVNAAELLRTKLAGMRRPEGEVLIGTVTDAYQPLEREYGLTRELLSLLPTTGFALTILTKSDLVIRDLDLLTAFDDCSVSLTITALDDAVRKALEPGAASPARRLEALRQLKAHGISSRVFIGPILPGLTDLVAVIAAVAPYADSICGEVLNLKALDFHRTDEALRRHFPDKRAAFWSAARSPAYWDGVEREMERLCAAHKVNFIALFRH